MKSTAPVTFGKQSIVTALFILCTFFSCQQKTESTTETTQPSTTTPSLTADTVTQRPAPAFYIIPEELDKQRVWICEGTRSDIFHVKHNCPVLVSCKGKGSFRNMSIHRAIVDFGRYNCQTCSKDLDHIFDEDLVR